LGEPKPVKGSHPVVALKPYWQQTIFGGKPAQQLFSPTVISLKAFSPREYKEGLRKPRGFFLALSLSLLMRVIMAAKTGALAEVPLSWRVWPPMTTL